MAIIYTTGSNPTGTAIADVIVAAGGGNDVIDAGAGNDVVYGDHEAANIDIESSNNSRFNAQPLGLSSRIANPDVADATRVPYRTVFSEGAGDVDWFSFSGIAGDTIVLDIDYAFDANGLGGGSFNPVVQLFRNNGTLMDVNDDAPASNGALGSSSDLDSFLSYTLTSTQTYFIRVSDSNAINVPVGATYALNVSNPGANVTGRFDEDFQGDDVIFGKAGDDRIYGMFGQDEIYGGTGNDSLFGGKGNDTIDGGIGDDIIFGGRAADDLFGGGGNDTINGGFGTDMIDGGIGNDKINGGIGADTIIGGLGADEINGNEADDVISGNGGLDVLSGNQGDDVIFGGNGSDEIYGGGENDKLYGEGGQDILFGDGGGDQLFGGLNSDTLSGGNGGDQIFGESGNDILNGDGGSDFLNGGAGNDQLFGGGFTDTLFGSQGDDRLFGGANADVFQFRFNSGTDRIFDWEDGLDMIEYDLGSVSSFGDLTITTISAGVRVTSTSGEIIVVDNTLTASDFTADDFIF